MIKSVIKKICPKFVMVWYHSLYFFAQRKYRAIKYRPLIEKTHEHYKEVAERIKNRGDRPLRFASYVVFDSTFGAYGLMDLMLDDLKHYSPKIIICPDVSRGDVHLKEQYKKTKAFFVNKYGAEYVVDGYDEKIGEFLDVSEQFDIIYCANPYDAMVNRVHGIEYLSTRNVLPIYMSYGTYVDKYGSQIVMPMLEISLFWKVFAETKYTYKDYQKYELYKGRNVVLSGYAKMDSFAKCTEINSSRRRIIIAPHHTISNKYLPLSNFLVLSDFILELPKRYPDIDFVFRPHPLLFVNLVNEGFWTNEQVDNYISDIKSLGIDYSFGGDYFDVFVNSDAIIHDCASFIMEYLYTGHPACFVSKKENKNIFSSLGEKCLENHYIATNKQEIIKFIDDVVVSGNDSLREKRNLFVTQKLAINYPNVSRKILEEISI